mmetsp:Transcript_22808/g.38060  ORF Transcript_22808/g.38060 Transcript_22808/m.38060 type:complete len:250 (-) Transcript_22808:370-1119(-)
MSRHCQHVVTALLLSASAGAHSFSCSYNSGHHCGKGSGGYGGHLQQDGLAEERPALNDCPGLCRAVEKGREQVMRPGVQCKGHGVCVCEWRGHNAIHNQPGLLGDEGVLSEAHDCFHADHLLHSISGADTHAILHVLHLDQATAVPILFSILAARWLQGGGGGGGGPCMRRRHRGVVEGCVYCSASVVRTFSGSNQVLRRGGQRSPGGGGYLDELAGDFVARVGHVDNGAEQLLLLVIQREHSIAKLHF